MNGLRIQRLALCLVLVTVIGLTGCVPRDETPREPFDATGLSHPLRSTPLGTHPEYASRYDAGWRLLLAGQPKEARSRFRDLLKFPPSGVAPTQLYPVHVGLGYVDLVEGRLGEAELQFETALRQRAGYASAYEGRALVDEARGDYAGALSELEAASGGGEIRPGLKLRADIIRLKAAELALSRARDLRQRGLSAEAMVAYREAADYAPDRQEPHRGMGEIYEQQEQWPEAALAYREAARVAPEDPEAWVRLAKVLSRQGELEQARQAVERALTLPGGEQAARGLTRQLREDVRSGASDKPEVQRVLEASVVDRAGLAAMLVTRLPLLERAARPPSRPPVITDIYNSWARAYIQEVVALGLMEIYDNHTFKPSQPVNRQDLARAVARTIRLMRASGWLAERPYPRVQVRDVPEFHLIYPEILEVLRYTVMSLDGDGTFDPERPVTGTEAAQVVDRTAALIR